MVKKPNPFYKLPKTDVPINLTSGMKETIDSVNKAVSDACELAKQQLTPAKQFFLMSNARFRSAGYALMIEDNPDQRIQSKRKTYAPVAFGSKIFSPAQLKISIYSKELLAIYKAFPELAHNLWERTKPTIVLTDNKTVTQFFPNEGNSNSAVERMWLRVAIQLQNSTHRQFSQHSSWLSLQTGTQSHGKDRLKIILTTII